jgi:hypothetical protein
MTNPIYEGLKIFIDDNAEPDPIRQKMNEHIKSRVDAVLADFDSPDDIDMLPIDQWVELRNRMQDIKVTLTPEGEIVDE